MRNYDDVHFDPPAPVAEVVLRDPASRRAVTRVPMLLDTGSDVTIVPRRAVEMLGASTASEAPFRLAAFDGSESVHPVVRLQLEVCGRRFTGRYVLHDEEIGILGRNVLNRLALLLDGPHFVWDRYSARPPWEQA